MQRQKSLAEIKSTCLESFKLPDDFSIRLQELEINLFEGTLTHETFKELFELYSVII
jgi:hypothetical protein